MRLLWIIIIFFVILYISANKHNRISTGKKRARPLKDQEEQRIKKRARVFFVHETIKDDIDKRKPIYIAKQPTSTPQKIFVGKVLGFGGSKHVYELSDRIALAITYPNLVDVEVWWAKKLQSFGLYTLNPELVYLSPTADMYPYMKAFISDNFSTFKKYNNFVVDEKSHLEVPKSLVEFLKTNKLENWLCVLKDYIDNDLPVMFTNHVSGFGDSFHLLLIGTSIDFECPYIARYIGYDFTTKGTSFRNFKARHTYQNLKHWHGGTDEFQRDVFRDYRDYISRNIENVHDILSAYTYPKGTLSLQKELVDYAFDQTHKKLNIDNFKGIYVDYDDVVNVDELVPLSKVSQKSL